MPIIRRTIARHFLALARAIARKVNLYDFIARASEIRTNIMCAQKSYVYFIFENVKNLIFSRAYDILRICTYKNYWQRSNCARVCACAGFARARLRALAHKFFLARSRKVLRDLFHAVFFTLRARLRVARARTRFFVRARTTHARDCAR